MNKLKCVKHGYKFLTLFLSQDNKCPKKFKNNSLENEERYKRATQDKSVVTGLSALCICKALCQR